MSSANPVAAAERPISIRHVPESAESADERAVWEIIEAEHKAFWSQDVERYLSFHAEGPHKQWWGWCAATGVTIHHNVAEFRRALDEHFSTWPEPNWYMISKRRFENKTIRVVGDVAWVTFEEVLDTDHLPGCTSIGGCVSLFQLLERQGGKWKIVHTNILDEQFGQTEVPSWQIDRSRRVLRQNAAAASHLKMDESDIAVVAGRLRMRDAATDVKFAETIQRIADPPGCFFFGSDAAPLVYDPADDSPVRVWWVVARSGKLFVSFNDPVLVRGRIEMAAKAFGLSPAQQRLAASIAGGLAVTEAAKREGVRVSTARTQLQRIYDKVGVHAQPVLVQALLTATLG